MPKLRIFSGREVCKLLTQHGFEEVRQKGSHIVMQKKSANSTVTVLVPVPVPVPKHTELKTGTLQSIIRQSGLPHSLFETK